MACAVSLKHIALILIVFLIIAVFTLPAAAAESNDTLPSVEWQTIYGGPASDTGYNAVETTDGYLVSGVTKSYGNGSYDTWLLKLDKAGNVLWNRTYGGTGGDWCYGLTPTSDGNYVMAGSTNSWGNGGFDIWMVKVNGNGDQLWSKTFGGPNNDASFSVTETKDGNYAVTGYWGTTSGDSDFVVLVTDPDGESLWYRTYQNGAQDWGKYIIATPDGGVAVSGWTRSTSGSNTQAYLLKVDENGDKEWGHAYGLFDGDSYGYGLVRADDGTYYLSGYTSAIGAGGTDFLVVKVDSDGSNWQERAYGNSGDELGSAVIPVDDGFIIGGYSDSYDNDRLWKVVLIKTDKDGEWLGVQSYGPEDTSVKASLALHTSDGGFLCVGNTNEYNSGEDDVFVMKLGEAGAAPAEDLVAKAAVPVAAVAAGTGISFLALFMGRIFDYLSSLLEKLLASVSELMNSVTKLPVFSVIYKFVYGFFNTYLRSRIIGRLNKIKLHTAVERVPALAGLSHAEILAILVSSVILGVAYIIAKKLVLFQLDTLIMYIFIAGFVMTLHDLTHRHYAIKFKSVTEYKVWGVGTLVAFLTAFVFGVTYAVPARTIINDAGKMGTKEQAIVYLSGPMVSAILAIAFLLLVPFGGTLQTIGLLGGSMNLLSAVYSLTPVNPMDGNKVYRWNKSLWAITFIPLLLLYLGVTIFLA